MIKTPDDCLNDATFWAIDRAGLQRHRLTCSCVYDTSVREFGIRLPPLYLRASCSDVPDFVIVVNPYHWERLSDDQRIKMLSSAVGQIETGGKDKIGRTSILVRKPTEKLEFHQGLLW